MASWAEEYEAKKAARLADEDKKLNKNKGFIGIQNSITKKNISEDRIKSENLFDNEKKMCGDEAKDTKAQVQTLSINEDNQNDTKTAKKSEHDKDDPWYTTYEAKKAAALDNFKSGNIQSVSGASGFVGQIEGVKHLSKQNEVIKVMNKLKEEKSIIEPIINMNRDNRDNDKESILKKQFVAKKCNFEDDSKTETAYSSKPPPPPRQLLQLKPDTWVGEPSSPPSDRPSRPSVPTPGKYGTLYGGAPSPGPNPSRSFQPPGFVPPTPPGHAASRPAWQDRKEKTSKEKNSFQSMVKSVKEDSKLSTSSWQEEYLARKRARLDKS